jgi:hypothetical protein
MSKTRALIYKPNITDDDRRASGLPIHEKMKRKCLACGQLRRHEVHLDRKLERRLGMLLKLQDLRRPAETR